MRVLDVTELMENETYRSQAYRYHLDILYSIYLKMDEKGLSKTELADKMGISKSQLSKLLNGEYRNMTLETVAKFDLALGLTEEEESNGRSHNQLRQRRAHISRRCARSPHGRQRSHRRGNL